MDIPEFPKWMYGPGGQAQIFYRAEDIPEGWAEHPSQVKPSSEAVVAAKPEPSGQTPAPVEGDDKPKTTKKIKKRADNRE